MPVASMRATEVAAYSDFLKAFAGAPPGATNTTHTVPSTPMHQQKTTPHTSPGSAKAQSCGLTASDPTTPTTAPPCVEKQSKDEQQTSTNNHHNTSKKNQKSQAAPKEKSKKSKCANKIRLPPHLRALLVRSQGRYEALMEQRELETQLHTLRYSTRAMGGMLNDRRIVPQNEEKRRTTWAIHYTSQFIGADGEDGEEDRQLVLAPPPQLDRNAEERIFSSGWCQNASAVLGHYHTNGGNNDDVDFDDDDDDDSNAEEDSASATRVITIEDTLTTTLEPQLRREGTVMPGTIRTVTMMSNTNTHVQHHPSTATTASTEKQSKSLGHATSHNPYIQMPVAAKTATMPPPNYCVNHCHHFNYYNQYYNNYYDNNNNNNNNNYGNHYYYCPEDSYNNNNGYHNAFSESGSFYVPESCGSEHSDIGVVSDWEE